MATKTHIMRKEFTLEEKMSDNVVEVFIHYGSKWGNNGAYTTTFLEFIEEIQEFADSDYIEGLYTNSDGIVDEDGGILAELASLENLQERGYDMESEEWFEEFGGIIDHNNYLPRLTIDGEVWIG